MWQSATATKTRVCSVLCCSCCTRARNESIQIPTRGVDRKDALLIKWISNNINQKQQHTTSFDLKVFFLFVKNLYNSQVHFISLLCFFFVIARARQLIRTGTSPAFVNFSSRTLRKSAEISLLRAKGHKISW